MTSTRVTHRIDVTGPAEAVYRIVSDVTRWPLYFPPTIWAERVSGDDREERIRIWALAQDEVRTWESRRRLRPDAYRVEFEQVRPADPVAELGGAWSVEERGDGVCGVTLDHHYRAAGDDPVNLGRIARAVEANSVSELANLKRVVDGRGREPELLLDFSDSQTIAGSAEDAYDFVYDVAKWPERIPHVQAVDLKEGVTGLQYMKMDTRALDGSVHTTVSGRVCTPSRRIVYKQTVLPPGLRAHRGEWLFEPAHDGTVTVTSRHVVILDPEALAALPKPPASLEAARAAVRHALGSNSRATMAVAKEFVEAR